MSIAEQIRAAEAPIPLGRDARPPSFPLHTLPQVARDFASAVSIAGNTPTDLCAAWVLGTMSAATFANCVVSPWAGWTEHTNLWIVVAADPSVGKGHTHSKCVAPLRELEKLRREQAAPAVAEAASELRIAERRLKRLEDAAAGDNPPDDIRHQLAEARERVAKIQSVGSPTIIADDITPEQIKTLLSENKGRLAIISAESSFFANLTSKRYSDAPNIEAALAAYSGDDIVVHRRDRAEGIKNPRMTACLAVQPSVLRDAYKNEAARQRGFFARPAYVVAPSNIGLRDMSRIPPAVPGEVTDAWARLVKNIGATCADLHETPIAFRLSEAALDRFMAWRAAMEPRLATTGDLASITAWCGKLHGQALRIAGVLHIAEHALDIQRAIDVVSENTMARAIELADYFLAHALVTFDVMDESTPTANARMVRDWYRAKGAPSFTQTEVRSAFRGRLGKDELAAALEVLCSHRWLTTREVRGKGRPATHYDVLGC